MSDRKDEDFGRINRRKFAKLFAVSSGIVGSGLTGSAAAKGRDQTEIRKVEARAGRKRAQAAVGSDAGQALLDALDDPDYELQGSKLIKVFIDNDLFSEIVEVPTAYGDLLISYRNDAVIHGGLRLSRSAIPESMRNELAGDIAWPEGSTGILTYQAPETVRFSRTVTSAESDRLESVTGRKAEPVSVGGRRTVGSNDGEFVVAYQDTVYTVDTAKGQITGTESTASSSGSVGIQSTCSEKGAFCVLDIIMASPHCTAAGIACGITGPATAACVVAVLAYCLPNVALVYVSGNCSYYYNNCM